STTAAIATTRTIRGSSPPRCSSPTVREGASLATDGSSNSRSFLFPSAGPPDSLSLWERVRGEGLAIEGSSKLPSFLFPSAHEVVDSLSPWERVRGEGLATNRPSDSFLFPSAREAGDRLASLRPSPFALCPSEPFTLSPVINTAAIAGAIAAVNNAASPPSACNNSVTKTAPIAAAKRSAKYKDPDTAR